VSEPFRILIADGLALEGLSKLRALSGVELIEKKQMDRQEVLQLLPSAHALVVRSKTQVDQQLLKVGTNLRLVIRAGIGLDNVDIKAATNAGVVVMNAPTGNIVTTAEHAIGMLFAISRRIPEADASVRTGKWEKTRFQGNEIRAKALGIVGLGNIGKAVAQRARGLEMKLCGYDPFLSPEAAAKLHVALMPLDELLSRCDYITLHVPLMDSTRHMINESAIQRMKQGAYLINCARGGLVDEVALLKALESGHLAGAALDVFETEPLPKDSPLLKHPRVVMTPHLGASTEEAQVQVGLEVAEQVAEYLGSGALRNAINVPNVSHEQLTLLKPYLNLCEAMGSFAGQADPPKTLKKIQVRFEGSLSEQNLEILTLAMLKGLLSSTLSTPVNFVNVRKILAERGIPIEQTFSTDCKQYTSLVGLKLVGEKTLSVEGTLFGRGEPRCVSIDQFDIDFLPQGDLLFTRNIDQPGVIGLMGTALGDNGVNIARMHLGRDAAKGEAIALLAIDSRPSDAVLKTLRQIKGMLSVQPLSIQVSGG